MSDKLKESLSAVIDSEADEFELRRVLDEIAKDIELRETWDRYHLVSNVIRGDHRVVGASDRMRARVWAAFQAETNVEPVSATPAEVPVATSTAPAARSSWIGRGVGIAVAAGVAFAVVFTTNFLDTETSSTPTLAQTSRGSLALQDTVESPLALEISTSDLRRSNAYMIHHVQQTALNNKDVLSFVKMVTFDPAE